MRRFLSVLVGLVLVLGAVSIAQAAPAATVMHGKVTAVNANDNTFTLQCRNGKDQLFKLEKTTKITDRGKIVGVAELKAGTPVAVTYTKAANEMTAQMVRVYHHHMRHMRKAKQK
ncbi:MAG: hypothetical protein LJE95_00115 [Acidobacteria bacterium]|jgi:hypothetical protein|nr:hypothetical protein [Acidobacteriota bacterium]